MCIGNTTSPAATNTTNVSWGDAWERPEVIPPQVSDPDPTTLPKKASLKTGKGKGTGKKSQSAKTSGGAY